MKKRLLIISLLVILAVFLISVPTTAKPDGYTYQWFAQGEDLTCDDLSKILGVKVTHKTTGYIVVGYRDDNNLVPILRQGVEIEFQSLPTDNQLDMVDAIYSDLTREGILTTQERIKQLEDTVAFLQSQINELSAKSAQ